MGRQSKRLKKIGKKSRKLKRQVGGQVALTVTTFAGGLTAGGTTAGSANATGTAATFRGPKGGAIDSAGNVYVADTSNHIIRRITPAGVVTTIAGSGTATAISTSGIILYTLGDGVGTAATFNGPTDIAINSTGTILYVVDSGNHKIRKIVIGGTSTLPTYTVSTIAGGGRATSYGIISGTTDSSGELSKFKSPNGITIDSAGNLYVADSGNNKIRKITFSGTSVTVSTVAGAGTIGSTNGSATTALFNNPKGITIDSAGTIYVADTDNDIIREINTEGVVSTLAGNAAQSYYIQFADGTGATAKFNTPTGICVDSNGNLYVADSMNNRIRKVTPDGVVSTLSGTSTSSAIDTTAGSAATFNKPNGVILDSNNNIFVFDSNNNKIRKITGGNIGEPSTTASAPTPPFTGRVDTFAGNGTATGVDTTAGPATNATFNQPSGGVFDFTGNMYVADTLNHKIRRITPAGVVTTVAGTGVATAIPTSGAVLYKLGDGVGTAATFNGPTNIVFDSNRTNLYVTDSGNHRIRKIAISGNTYTVSTVAGGARTSSSTISGTTNGDGATAKFNNPTGIVVDSAGNLYVADTRNHVIRKITFSGTTVTVSTVAGSGVATVIPTTGIVPYTFGDDTGITATFNMPTDIIFDSTGSIMYVADSGNHKIRRITISGSLFTVSTIAGGRGGTSGAIDGAGARAKFNNPNGIIMDFDNNLYVADSNNDKIRKIIIGGTAAAPTYTVSTMAGTGTATAVDGPAVNATFNTPKRLLLDYDGAILYVFDTNNNRIRKITGGNLPEPTSVNATLTAISGASTEYPIVSHSNKIDEITFQKLKRTTAWDAPLYSNRSIPGDKSCYIAFKPGQITSEFIIGLNDSISTTNPTDLTHSTSIDRGFHMNKEGNGKFYITEFGAKIDGTDGTYEAGDVFNIIYDTTKFIYIKNGTRIKTTPLNDIPTVLYLDGSMYDYKTIIENVYFGMLNNCPVPATT